MVLSGRLRVQMANGEEYEMGPGDVGARLRGTVRRRFASSVMTMVGLSHLTVRMVNRLGLPTTSIAGGAEQTILTNRL
jgi:quercetin dioxygenase-like cupin family protein